MGETTKIEWAHHTVNLWRGCTKVHTGCTNCYAEKLVTTRLGGAWGRGAPRQVAAPSTWLAPLRWARAAAKAGERRRIFMSLCDPLDEEAPIDAQARLWGLIRDTALVTPHGDNIFRCGGSLDGRPVSRVTHAAGVPLGGLDWLLLSKRPERWELVPEDVRPLVWLGTSVSDQKTADEWVPRLLASRGFARRFLSIEPLVGPVDLRYALPQECAEPIDWVIVGGESGPKARPCDVAWIRSIVQQCAAASVPCFVKQLGSYPAAGNVSDVGLTIHDKKGGDPSEWPEDLRVREMPNA